MALAHIPAPTDPLHGGQGSGAKVIGHSELGGAGLNGHVAVLGKYAYVGFGANGGTGFQWNKTPVCNDAGYAGPAGTVKVVDLTDPASPTVVSQIQITDLDPETRDNQVVARDVAAIKVQPVSHLNAAFTGDLLAVAIETCGRNQEGGVGVNFYDVNNPASPVFLGADDRFLGNVATRSVSLVQRPDGRVLSLEANQGGLAGGIHAVDATNPRAPLPVGTFDKVNGAASTQECRPFSFAQGVVPNAAGNRAYGAYQDGGLFVLDLDTLPVTATDPAPNLPRLSSTKYDAKDEGNSFRYVPNASETVAVATDEDLLPAKTNLTITSGGSSSQVIEPGKTVPGVFRGCEAIAGAPLYRSATPSVSAEIIYIQSNAGCLAENYPATTSGKIALIDRGGTCGFEDKAKLAQKAGAVAALIANVGTDHHVGGTGVLFSPDMIRSGDAGLTIPTVMVTREARNAIVNDLNDEDGPVIGTLADTADTWGALRVFDLSGINMSNPDTANSAADPYQPATQVATFNSPHSNTMPPSTMRNGLFHAVNTIWDGTRVLTAWMSDGLRMVDLSTPANPKAGAYYVPPAASDPTGNNPAVPLVVDVEKFGSHYVMTDINGGLYVLNMIKTKSQCKNGGHADFGFPNQGTCVDSFSS